MNDRTGLSLRDRCTSWNVTYGASQDRMESVPLRCAGAGVWMRVKGQANLKTFGYRVANQAPPLIQTSTRAGQDPGGSPLQELWMKLTGDRNQCPTCGQLFKSTHAFEKHRTGEFGKDRRCRTEEEMSAKGMFKGDDGFWRGSIDTRSHVYG